MDNQKSDSGAKLEAVSDYLLYDPTVEKVGTLLAGLREGVCAMAVPTHSDPHELIDRVLAQSGIKTLHLLGHGAPGEIMFGTHRVTAGSWREQVGACTTSLSTIPTPRHINFWSCKTGEGETGMNFIKTIANQTNAVVSASSSLVGHPDKGGSWALDRHADPQVPFSVEALSAYKGTLDLSLGGYSIQDVIDRLNIPGIPATERIVIQDTPAALALFWTAADSTGRLAIARADELVLKSNPESPLSVEEFSDLVNLPELPELSNQSEILVRDTAGQVLSLDLNASGDFANITRVHATDATLDQAMELHAKGESYTYELDVSNSLAFEGLTVAEAVVVAGAGNAPNYSIEDGFVAISDTENTVVVAEASAVHVLDTTIEEAHQVRDFDAQDTDTSYTYSLSPSEITGVYTVEDAEIVLAASNAPTVYDIADDADFVLDPANSSIVNGAQSVHATNATVDQAVELHTRVDGGEGEGALVTQARAPIGDEDEMYPTSTFDADGNGYFIQFVNGSAYLTKHGSDGTLLETTELPLPVGASYAGATDIVLVGTDIYASANFYGGSVSQSGLWKVGSFEGVAPALTILPTPAGASDSYPTELVVSGTDVYVIGNASDDNYNSQVVLWKADSTGTGVQTSTILSDNTGSYPWPSSVAVSGTDVFVTVNSGYGDNYQQLLFKGDSTGSFGEPVELLPPNEFNNFYANGVVVNDSGVYVTGSVRVNDSVTEGALLKLDSSGAVVGFTKLQGPSYSNHASGTDIISVGGDLYIAGNYNDYEAGLYNEGLLWKVDSENLAVDPFHVLPSDPRGLLVDQQGDVVVEGYDFSARFSASGGQQFTYDLNLSDPTVFDSLNVVEAVAVAGADNAPDYGIEDGFAAFSDTANTVVVAEASAVHVLDTTIEEAHQVRDFAALDTDTNYTYSLSPSEITGVYTVEDAEIVLAASNAPADYDIDDAANVVLDPANSTIVNGAQAVHATNATLDQAMELHAKGESFTYELDAFDPMAFEGLTVAEAVAVAGADNAPDYSIEDGFVAISDTTNTVVIAEASAVHVLDTTIEEAHQVRDFAALDTDTNYTYSLSPSEITGVYTVEDAEIVLAASNAPADYDIDDAANVVLDPANSLIVNGAQAVHATNATLDQAMELHAKGESFTYELDASDPMAFEGLTVDEAVAVAGAGNAPSYSIEDTFAVINQVLQAGGSTNTPNLIDAGDAQLGLQLVQIYFDSQVHLNPEDLVIPGGQVHSLVPRNANTSGESDTWNVFVQPSVGGLVDLEAVAVSQASTVYGSWYDDSNWVPPVYGPTTRMDYWTVTAEADGDLVVSAGSSSCALALLDQDGKIIDHAGRTLTIRDAQAGESYRIGVSLHGDSYPAPFDTDSVPYQLSTENGILIQGAHPELTAAVTGALDVHVSDVPADQAIKIAGFAEQDLDTTYTYSLAEDSLSASLTVEQLQSAMLAENWGTFGLDYQVVDTSTNLLAQISDDGSDLGLLQGADGIGLVGGGPIALNIEQALAFDAAGIALQGGYVILDTVAALEETLAGGMTVPAVLANAESVETIDGSPLTLTIDQVKSLNDATQLVTPYAIEDTAENVQDAVATIDGHIDPVLVNASGIATFGDEDLTLSVAGARAIDSLLTDGGADVYQGGYVIDDAPQAIVDLNALPFLSSPDVSEIRSGGMVTLSDEQYDGFGEKFTDLELVEVKDSYLNLSGEQTFADGVSVIAMVGETVDLSSIDLSSVSQIDLAGANNVIVNAQQAEQLVPDSGTFGIQDTSFAIQALIAKEVQDGLLIDLSAIDAGESVQFNATGGPNLMTVSVSLTPPSAAGMWMLTPSQLQAAFSQAGQTSSPPLMADEVDEILQNGHLQVVAKDVQGNPIDLEFDIQTGEVFFSNGPAFVEILPTSESILEALDVETTDNQLMTLTVAEARYYTGASEYGSRYSSPDDHWPTYQIRDKADAISAAQLDGLDDQEAIFEATNIISDIGPITLDGLVAILRDDDFDAEASRLIIEDSTENFLALINDVEGLGFEALHAAVVSDIVTSIEVVGQSDVEDGVAISQLFSGLSVALAPESDPLPVTEFRVEGITEDILAAIDDGAPLAFVTHLTVSDELNHEDYLKIEGAIGEGQVTADLHDPSADEDDVPLAISPEKIFVNIDDDGILDVSLEGIDDDVQSVTLTVLDIDDNPIIVMAERAQSIDYSLTVDFNGAGSEASWIVEPIDVSLLADGPLDISVRVVDALGNEHVVHNTEVVLDRLSPEGPGLEVQDFGGVSTPDIGNVPTFTVAPEADAMATVVMTGSNWLQADEVQTAAEDARDLAEALLDAAEAAATAAASALSAAEMDYAGAQADLDAAETAATAAASALSAAEMDDAAAQADLDAAQTAASALSAAEMDDAAAQADLDAAEAAATAAASALSAAGMDDAAAQADLDAAEAAATAAASALSAAEMDDAAAQADLDAAQTAATAAASALSVAEMDDAAAQADLDAAQTAATAAASALSVAEMDDADAQADLDAAETAATAAASSLSAAEMDDAEAQFEVSRLEDVIEAELLNINEAIVAKADATVTINLTGTGTEMAVTLTQAQVAALGDGMVQVTATQVDAAGNTMDVAPSTDSFEIDTQNPQTTSVETAEAMATDANNREVTYSVSFDEPVQAFTAANVTVVGGVAPTSVTLIEDEDGEIIGATFTVVAHDDSTAPLSVEIVGVKDLAGNNAAVVTSALTPVDTQNPDTLVATDAEMATDGNNREVTYSVSFDEPVQDFTAANVTVMGGAKPTSVTLVKDEDGEIIGATFTVVAHDDSTSPLSVSIGGVKDLAGNNAAVVTSALTPVDTQNPDTLVATQEALASDANREVTYSVSFDEPVQAFTAANVTVMGGAKPTSVTLVKDEDGEIIGATFNVVAHDDSTAPLSVSIGGVKDLAGNDAAVVTSAPTPVDTVNPDTLSVVTTETLASDGDNTVTYEVRFDEPVQSFAPSNINVLGGTRPASVTPVLEGGKIVGARFDVVAHDDSTAPLSVEIVGVKDLAGNDAAAVTSAPTRVDTQNPDTLVETQEEMATDANRVVTYSVSFDEPVQAFTAANVMVEGGAAPTSVTLIEDEDGEIIGATFNVVAHDDSTAPLSVSIGGVKDLAGNDAAVVTSAPTPVDTVNPTAPALSVVDVGGVSTPDVVAGATVFTVSPEAGATAAVVMRGSKWAQADADLSAATDAKDAAQLAYDHAQGQIADAPVVREAVTAVTQGEVDAYLAGAPVVREAVTAVTQDEVDAYLAGAPVVRGAVTAVTQDEVDAYLAGAPVIREAVTAVTQDEVDAYLAGAPVVREAVTAVTQDEVDAYLAGAPVVREAVTAVTQGEVDAYLAVPTAARDAALKVISLEQAKIDGATNALADATVTIELDGTGTEMAITLTQAQVAALGDGMVVVTATQVDAAGNTMDVAPSTDSFEIDTQNPDTLVATEEALASDANREVMYSVSFDEPVQAFTAANVTVEGGVAPTSVTLIEDEDGKIIGATFNVVAHDDSTAPLSVEIVGVKDLAGNDAAAVTSAPTRVDTQNPDTLVETQEEMATDANREVTYSVSFDEPVQAFTAANVTVEGGVAPTSVTLIEDEDGKIIGATFNVVAHDDSTSPLSVSIGGVKDLAGNDAAPVVSAPTPVDTVNPDTLSVGTTQTLASDGYNTVTYKVSFDEPVQGFDPSNIHVLGGVPVSPESVTLELDDEDNIIGATFDVVAHDDSTSPLSVSIGGVKDLAGNDAAPVVSAPTLVDTRNPSTLSVGTTETLASDVDNTVTYKVSFDEPVQGFDPSNIHVLGGVPVSPESVTLELDDEDNIIGATFDVVAHDDSTSPLSVSIGGVKDLAGNDAAPVVSAPTLVDTRNPSTLSVGTTETLASDIDNTVTYKVSFDEPVQGFDPSNIHVLGGVPVSPESVTLELDDEDNIIGATFDVVAHDDSTSPLSVSIGGVKDLAGNDAAEVEAEPVAVDTLNPSAPVLDVADLHVTAAEAASGMLTVTAEEGSTVSLVLRGTNFDQAEGEKDAATIAKGNALATVSSEQAKIDAATAAKATASVTVSSEQAKISAATSAKATASATVSSEQAKIDTATSAKVTASATVTSEQAKIDAAQLAKSAAQTTINSVTATAAQKATATSTLAAEQAKIDAATSAKATASATVSSEQAKIDAATSAKATASATVSSEQAKIDAATSAKALAEATVASEQAKIDTATSAKSAAAATAESELLKITQADARMADSEVEISLEGTGEAQQVALAAAELAALGEGEVEVSATQVDAVGNIQEVPASKANFTIDTVAPTVAAPGVVSTDLLITDSDAGKKLEISVSFNEAMDISTDPTLSLSASVGVSPSASAGRWVNEKLYVADYDVTDINIDAKNITVSVAGAKDAAGNLMASYVPAAEFSVDTLNPTSTASTNGKALLADADVGSGKLQVSLTFNEVMDPQSPISVQPNAADTGLLFKGGTWNQGNTVFTANFDLSDNNVDARNLTFSVSGALDANGNPSLVSPDQSVVSIDTKNAGVTGVVLNDTLLSDADVGNGKLSISVTFDEAMDKAVAPTLGLMQAPAGVSFASGSWNQSGTTYEALFNVDDSNVDVRGIRVDVSGAKDLAGNTMVSHSSAPVLAVDTKNPTISLNPVSGGFINDAEDESNVIVSGTTVGVENGQVVSLTVGGIEIEATVNNNQFVANLTPQQMQSLPQGQISVEASITDLAGNASNVATADFIYDTQKPLAPELWAKDAQAQLQIQLPMDAVPSTLKFFNNGSDVTNQFAVTPINMGAKLYSINLVPGSPLTQTLTALTASVEDLAGNRSTASIAMADISVDDVTVVPASQFAYGADGIDFSPLNGPNGFDTLDLSNGGQFNLTVDANSGFIFGGPKGGLQAPQFDQAYEGFVTGGGDDLIVGRDSVAESFYAGAGNNEIDGGGLPVDQLMGAEKPPVDMVDYSAAQRLTTSVVVSGANGTRTVTVGGNATQAVAAGRYVLQFGSTLVTATFSATATAADLAARLNTEIGKINSGSGALAGVSVAYSAGSNVLTLSATANASKLLASLQVIDGVVADLVPTGFDPLVGDVVYRADGGSDTLFNIEGVLGTAYNDVIVSRDGAPGVSSLGAARIIDGGAGNDTITGSRGNDVLVGGAGADVIRGGAGRDIIVGGAGKDLLFGGEGRDRFVITQETDTDTVADFDVSSFFANMSGRSSTTNDRADFLLTEQQIVEKMKALDATASLGSLNALKGLNGGSLPFYVKLSGGDIKSSDVGASGAVSATLELHLKWGEFDIVVSQVQMAWDTNPFASLPVVDPITGNPAIYWLKSYIQPQSDNSVFDLFPEISESLFNTTDGIIRVSASLMFERDGQIMDLTRNDATVGTTAGDIFYIGGGNDTNASVKDIVVGGRGADLYEVRVEGVTNGTTPYNHGTTIVNDLGSRTGAEQDAVLIEGIRSLADIDFARTTVASEGEDRSLQINYTQHRGVDDLSTDQDETEGGGMAHAEGTIEIFNQYTLSQPQYRVEKLVIAQEAENPMAAAVKTYFLGVAQTPTAGMDGDKLQALADRDSILVGNEDKADEFVINFPSQLAANLADPQEVWIYGWKDTADKITINGLPGSGLTKVADNNGEDGSYKFTYKSGNATLDLYFAGVSSTSSAEIDLIKNKLSWS
ncbi:RTX calcium-binding nonapeptide repeat [Oxalobacteraceae bacterium]